MGGDGSSRWHRHSKYLTVDECLCLDIMHFAQDKVIVRQTAAGRICWRNTPQQSKLLLEDIRFRLDMTGAVPTLMLHYIPVVKECLAHEVAVTVYLQHTHPFYGGMRWWFTCPSTLNGHPCNKRVRKLYLPPGEQYFGCRECHALTYRSVQAHDKRVDALRKLAPEAMLFTIMRHLPKRASVALQAIKRLLPL